MDLSAWEILFIDERCSFRLEKLIVGHLESLFSSLCVRDGLGMALFHVIELYGDQMRDGVKLAMSIAQKLSFILGNIVSCGVLKKEGMNRD